MTRQETYRSDNKVMSGTVSKAPFDSSSQVCGKPFGFELREKSGYFIMVKSRDRNRAQRSTK